MRVGGLRDVKAFVLEEQSARAQEFVDGLAGLDDLRDARHWLILHGRYVCKARKPECPKCLIRDLCEFRHKTANSKC